MKKSFFKSLIIMVCVLVFGIGSAFALKNLNSAYAAGYSATFYPNGGTWNSSNTTEARTVNYTDKFYFSESRLQVSKSGCTWQGWTVGSTSGKLLKQYVDSAENGQKLYASWSCTQTTYKVSFNLNGGSGNVPTQTVVSGGKVSVPSQPTKSGYVFKYWSKTPGGTAYNFSESVNSDFTLYAIWQENKKYYTVSFNLNGGSGNVPSQTIEEGKTVSKPSNPTKSGYSFKHWSTSSNGSAYNFSASVKSNFTLYAVWEANKTYYKVEFDLNGGTGNIATQNVEKGKSASVPNNPIRSGYTFKYWSTSANGGAYNFNNSVNGNLKLYAIWEKNPSGGGGGGSTTTYYTVSFNLNGGTGNIDSQKIVKGSQASKPVDPTKENAVFDGWFTDSSCKTKYDFNKSVTNDITLYACFINNYTVNFVKQGLPYIDSYTKTFKENSTLQEYNQNHTITIVDTSTYSMIDASTCSTYLMNIYNNLSSNELSEKCSNFANKLNCSNNSECFGSKYLVITEEDSREIVYLKTNNIINVEYEIYDYIGLYRDRDCSDKYNYSNSITKNLNLYECYVLQSKNNGGGNIVVDPPEEKNSGKIITIILIILALLSVVGVVLYFIRKSKIANSVD